ncbi:MAG: UDP-N-acetylmuramoyl-L-alanyl-D-glutamate--2,6-diaminopimelate ligase [Bacillota bacterium]
MQALELFKELEYKDIIGSVDHVIDDLVQDSRKAGSKKLFVAREGFVTDGHNFIEDAYQRGSRVFIIEKKLDEFRDDCLYLLVDNSAQIIGKAAAKIFDHPENNLKIIGITGTNGKTTTSYLIKWLLEKSGYKAGLIGTISIDTGQKIISSTRTTPEASDIYRSLALMRDNGCQYVVMEVSSHALSLQRTEGLNFLSAIFTNISRDHLDFHNNFTEYLQAKLKLVDQLKDNGKVYYNKDDKRLRDAMQDINKNKVSYSIERPADYKADDIKLYQNKITFDLHHQSYQINMSGRFNVYNCLSALSCLLELGFTNKKLKEALNTFPGVPGRFEYIPNKSGITVLVDYAHSPAGMKNVLNSVNEIKESKDAKVVAVFGCGGDRDKVKRPEMGIIGYEGADEIILTSDNPRSESPRKIIKDIEEGLKAEYRNPTYKVFLDRSLAIEKAVKYAEPGDIVVIFGKGHETYQEFADKIIQFDDREVARTALRKREEEEDDLFKS